MSKDCLLIRTLTNLHVGSGDSHYGVIDNLVQRDSLTGYPGIHASSLKGALRQAFAEKFGENDPHLRQIFGDGPKGTQPGQAGKYHLSPASLLSFPVRSDKVPFVRVTAPGLLRALLDSQTAFGFELPARAALDELLENSAGLTTAYALRPALTGAILERHSRKTDRALLEVATDSLTKLEALLGDALVLVPDAWLSELCGENRLPVLARNCLENGISRNLWYEEIVPRQTRLWCWLLKPDDSALTTPWNEVLEQPVQIGANASIGYGYCELKTL